MLITKPNISRSLSNPVAGTFTFYARPGKYVDGVITRIQHRLYDSTTPSNLKWTLDVSHTAFVVGTDPKDGEPIILDNIIPKCVVHRQDAVSDRILSAVVTPNFLPLLKDMARDDIIDKMVSEALLLTGKPYSWWEILGIFYWSIATLAGRTPARNPIRGGTVCTEQVLGLKKDFERYCHITDPVNNTMDKDTTFPAQLLNAFVSSSFYKVVAV